MGLESWERKKGSEVKRDGFNKFGSLVRSALGIVSKKDKKLVEKKLENFLYGKGNNFIVLDSKTLYKCFGSDLIGKIGENNLRTIIAKIVKEKEINNLIVNLEKFVEKKLENLVSGEFYNGEIKLDSKILSKYFGEDFVTRVGEDSLREKILEAVKGKIFKLRIIKQTKSFINGQSKYGSYFHPYECELEVLLRLKTTEDDNKEDNGNNQICLKIIHESDKMSRPLIEEPVEIKYLKFLNSILEKVERDGTDLGRGWYINEEDCINGGVNLNNLIDWVKGFGYIELKNFVVLYDFERGLFVSKHRDGEKNN